MNRGVLERCKYVSIRTETVQVFGKLTIYFSSMAESLDNGIRQYTNKNKEQISAYGAMKPFSTSEQNELFKRAKAGDKKARELLIESNLKLVMYLVNKKFIASKIERDDLISIGSIGLIKAVDTFCIERGTKFTTYASICITNQILMELRREKKRINDVSLDTMLSTLDKNDGLTLGDTICDPNQEIDKLLEEQIQIFEVRQAVGTLSKREQKIIWLYYSDTEDKKTQLEIATMTGLSQSYVSRLKTCALTKIKEKIEGE